MALKQHALAGFAALLATDGAALAPAAPQAGQVIPHIAPEGYEGKAGKINPRRGVQQQENHQRPAGAEKRLHRAAAIRIAQQTTLGIHVVCTLPGAQEPGLQRQHSTGKDDQAEHGHHLQNIRTVWPDDQPHRENAQQRHGIQRSRAEHPVAQAGQIQPRQAQPVGARRFLSSRTAIGVQEIPPISE